MSGDNQDVITQVSGLPATELVKSHHPSHCITCVSSIFVCKLQDRTGFAILLCTFHLTGVVAAALVADEFQKLMMTMPQDGFRPGQPLPLAKLVQEAGGQARFKTAVVEKILGDAMPLVSVCFWLVSRESLTVAESPSRTDWHSMRVGH